jgi:hypothetical protein
LVATLDDHFAQLRRGVTVPPETKMKRLRRQDEDLDHAAGGLGVLPVSLLREHIFPFVAALPLLSAETLDVHSLQAQLAPLRRVSRHWHAIAQSLWEQARDITHTLLLATGDEEECTHLQQGAQRGGASAKLLQIVVGEVETTNTTGPFVCKAFASIDSNALRAFTWAPLLSEFQHIVRLDLSLVLFALVGDVLAAAAVSCVHVKALVLPFSPSVDERSQGEYGTSETQSLIDALQKWRHRNGGLRLLHVPYWPAHHHTQLLEAIIAYCPAIWYLRGWHLESKTREVMALATAESYLWREFCCVCTELREFDWRLASMWGANVDAFSEHVKLFLREMVIEEARGRSNVDYALQSVQSLLRATPQLRQLRVQLQDRMFFLIAENHAAYADLSTTIADAFVTRVLTQCPRVEQFHYRMRSSDRELAVTDHAISVLIGTPSIRDLLLTRVVFDTASLVTIVQNSKQRRLNVNLTAANAAHVPILTLLDYFAHDDGAMDGVRLELVVAREDMVRATYPRGVLVKDLVTEIDLQNRLTALQERVPSSTRFHLALKVFTFGVETRRHAICEMVLRVNEAREDELEQRVKCDIYHTFIPRYKRKAGRLV